MRFTITGAAAALVLATMTPAMAQAPAPMMLGDWSGFYLGANLGGAGGTGNFSGGGITTGNFNLRGPLGGGTAGFNWQLNPSWVASIEGDIDGTGIGGTP